MKGEKNNIIVGLDIGTTKICAIVGQLAENGKINILGIGKSSSQGGVSRGMVANVSKVVQAIQEAVEQAEKVSQVKINRSPYKKPSTPRYLESPQWRR
jgi:cell division protein FtsA